MRKMVLFLLTSLILVAIASSVKAQSRIDEIAKNALEQQGLADAIKKLESTTGVLCITDYPDTCKRVLELLSMDTELIATFKSLRSQNIVVFVYSIVGGFNQGNYIDRGGVFIWAGYSIPEIRKFFGLLDLFPADLIDMYH